MLTHERNIIHLDLKPANVIVGDFGETVVIDWGLAKDLTSDSEDAFDAGSYRAELDIEGLTIVSDAATGAPRLTVS